MMVDRVTYKNTKYCAGTESLFIISSLRYLNFVQIVLGGESLSKPKNFSYK